MRIGVNTRLLLEGRMDGIGWFAYETLRRMVSYHPEHEFFFFFDRKPSKQFLFADNVTPVVVNPPARHPILWWLFFEVGIARVIKKHNIELFLSPDGFIPLHSKVKTIDVIHDINFAHFSNNMRWSHQRYMEYFFPKYARKATHVVTVSDYSKRDIADTYGVDGAKISVVYNGAGMAYKPLSESKKQTIRSKYSGGKPFFLFVSTILRRKNLANLLKAFDLVRESKDYKLVVVGAKVWWKAELKSAYNSMNHSDDVIFIGRAEADELSKLMSSATALVYPSFFEGFGIPIVEAFNAETAVITSNTSSMPEVAGDAALLVNPHNVNEISNAMLQLVENHHLRESLIERGRERRKLFSWDKAAEELWAVLLDVTKG